MLTNDPKPSKGAQEAMILHTLGGPGTSSGPYIQLDEAYLKQPPAECISGWLWCSFLSFEMSDDINV